RYCRQRDATAPRSGSLSSGPSTSPKIGLESVAATGFSIVPELDQEGHTMAYEIRNRPPERVRDTGALLLAAGGLAAAFSAAACCALPLLLGSLGLGSHGWSLWHGSLHPTGSPC